MNHKERFLATIERKPVDRPASWLGLPVPDAIPGLLKHFGCASIEELKRVLNDDVWAVELPYHSPTSDAIYMAFNFSQAEHPDPTERTLTQRGFFHDCSDPACVENFPWPDPTQYIDPAECRNVIESIPEEYAILGVLWSAHFQDACAAFGMETALMKMVTEPEMFQAVIDRITQFYLQANAVFYE